MASKSRGIVVFGFNNELINYVRLAAFTSTNLRRNLPYPITLVTDAEECEDFNAFDSVVVFDPIVADNERDYPGFGKFANFRNRARMYADIVSPYDRTLVLDADYLCHTDALVVPMESTRPFLAPSRLRDFLGNPLSSHLSRISDTGLEVYWATAMIFDRDAPITREVFSIVRKVEKEWSYFCRLYRLPGSQFRNDFALTIALHHIQGLTGHVHHPEMDTYAFALKESPIIPAGDGTLFLLDDRINTARAARDIHVLDKSNLAKIAGALVEQETV